MKSVMKPSANMQKGKRKAGTLSQELQNFRQRLTGRSVRIAEILAATKGRGFHLLLVILALPFLTPIPLPGFSIPFGLIVFFIGFRLALGRKPWLPARLLAREISPKSLRKILRAASRLVRLLEFFVRPRLAFLQQSPVFARIAGALIMVSGLFLVLPLPLPFSNSLPAFTVVLLAAGALERDGLFFLAGCSMFAVSLGYFVLLAIGGTQAIETILSG
jgi:hypothetical protein